MYPVGGPDIFTFRQIGMLAAEVMGRPGALKIRRMPLWALRLAAAVAPACGTLRLRNVFCSKRDTPGGGRTER